jgi:hypothetical protein
MVQYIRANPLDILATVSAADADTTNYIKQHEMKKT